MSAVSLLGALHHKLDYLSISLLNLDPTSLCKWTLTESWLPHTFFFLFFLIFSLSIRSAQACKSDLWVKQVHVAVRKHLKVLTWPDPALTTCHPKLKSHLRRKDTTDTAGVDKGVFVRHTCRKTGTPNSDPARPCQTSSSKGACIREGKESSSKMTGEGRVSFSVVVLCFVFVF